MNEEQVTRLECLQIASRSCGEDVAYNYVLEAAKAYWGFVHGNKVVLKVFSNDHEVS